jgi:hypothetical protein
MGSIREWCPNAESIGDCDIASHCTYPHPPCNEMVEIIGIGEAPSF